MANRAERKPMEMAPPERAALTVSAGVCMPLEELLLIAHSRPIKPLAALAAMAAPELITGATAAMAEMPLVEASTIVARCSWSIAPWPGAAPLAERMASRVLVHLGVP